SGKVCIVKVDSEHRAEEMLRELLMLISKAYEAYVRLGPVREDTLEARRRLNVMSIYWLLPKTNCRACGEPGCMAFAFKLLSGETQISKCKPLLEEPKFKDAYEKLKAMMSSPIGW
ncbi:MAG: (Fe-S)-binding protein, partial [Candidatus Nezhaarchaeales archaeon]